MRSGGPARLLWFLCVACRGASVAPYELPPEPGAGEAGEVATAPTQPANEGGKAGAAVDAAPDVAGGAPPDDGSCQAQRVTLEEIHSGRVQGGTPIAVAGLVASSQKFLVSEAKSGSCLWGAFVADPARSGARSGLLLVSFGEPHEDGVACRAGTDGLPDDLAPGDLADVRGVLDSHAPSACAEVAPSLQLRIDASCPLQRRGRAVSPEPALIDTQLADELARGRDDALLREWGGATIMLESLSARVDPNDGDAVFPFGVVQFVETSLSMSSRLYYFDLSAGGPRDPDKAPHYDFPALFGSVSGIVMLDYCSWVLAPRSVQAAGP